MQLKTMTTINFLEVGWPASSQQARRRHVGVQTADLLLGSGV